MRIFNHGGNLREAAENYNISAEKIIDFSSNINPLGIPPEIKKIVIKDIDSIFDGACRYPDPECKLLKDVLSANLGVKTSNLLIGNGSNELIYLLVHVLDPERVLIPIPSFSEYERAAVSTGAECRFLSFKINRGSSSEFNLKVDKVLQSIDGVNLIFICNPNNPTGFLLHKDEIEYLIRKCEERNVFVIIDEAFIDFVEGNEDAVMIGEAIKNKNVAVLRSMTKFFAIAGLRLGYLVGNSKLVKKISENQPTWSVNCLAQLVGKELIKNYDFTKKSKEYILKQRAIFFKNLKKIDWLEPYESSANFILCEIKNNRITAGELNRYCLEKERMLIRDCSNFRGLDDYFFRVAVKKHGENKRLVHCLTNIDKDKF